MSGAERPRTVGILADLPRGVGGGVMAFTRSFVAALIARPFEGLRYVVFTAEGDPAWFPEADHVAIAPVERSDFPSGLARWRGRAVRYAAAAGAAVLGQTDRARYVAKRWARQRAIARGLARSPWPLDAVHFPFQDFTPTPAPSIYSPWDLQHRHLRELWPRRARLERDAYYRDGCRRAALVLLASEWARDDVVSAYRIPPERTAVVPAAAPTRVAAAPDDAFCREVARKHDLPARFLYYPAATWPHKNHHTLIGALGLLGPAQQDVELVCSGASRPRQRDELLAHARASGVEGRVRFLGYVDDREVRALYRLAQACVFPSLFEGAGMPVLEAFEEGCPVVASNVTCIPEYAGDAVLYVDPRDPRSIAAGVARMLAEPALRAELGERGRERAGLYSWERLTEMIVPLYRRLVGAPRPPEPVAEAWPSR